VGERTPRPSRTIPNRPQLLTYPDSLGGDLKALTRLLRGPLAGLFRGVHVLPPYPSSGDRGFAPVTYDEIDPRFGTWADLREIASEHDLMLDVMVNHISRRSVEFRDVEAHGFASPYADLFITPGKVWPRGRVPADDVARLFLRRSTGPFSTVTTEAGERLTFWTTFGEGEVSEQVDLDLFSQAGRDLVRRWMRSFARRGVAILRLDAVGYVVKKAGTDCFMVEPEIWEVLDWMLATADSLGMAILPEVHDRYTTHERLAARGFLTYDFTLPGLLLHASETGDQTRLAAHLDRSPRGQITTVDCHDGIPVLPDLEGVLSDDEMRALADLAVRHGGNINRLLTPGRAVGSVDAHQLNLTYYSALDEDDDRYLAARAIQLFARGTPQIYYVGLLAGSNDLATVARTGEGRSINRHDYSSEEIERALDRPVVRRLLDLIRLRNTHPAFDGDLKVSADGGSLGMRWESGADACELTVDPRSGAYAVYATGADGRWTEYAA
jgi:sucrose 6(F)-phosphate phosphorylase